MMIVILGKSESGLRKWYGDIDIYTHMLSDGHPTNYHNNGIIRGFHAIILWRGRESEEINVMRQS